MPTPTEPDSGAREEGAYSDFPASAESAEGVLLARLGGDSADAWISIDALGPTESPRLDGVDVRHVDSLAEIGDGLPPILVQRSTMGVIDGMHRLSAARAAGHATIRARLIDCDDEEAFLLAVAANVRHGRPLTLAERRAAAARVMQMRPDASDRWIAELAGLAAKTVASIRREPGRGSGAQPDARLGRDGRVRPVNGAAGRERAARLWLDNPGLSVRQIARDAGISVGTAWDVRRKLRDGAPAPGRDRADISPAGAIPPKTRPVTAAAAGTSELLERLRHDPALRYTESGRSVLRWLSPPRILDVSDWADIVGLIPPHAAYGAAQLARRCAQAWLGFAHELEHHGGVQEE